MMGPLNSQERTALFFICFVLGLGLLYGYLKKTTGCNTCLIDIYSSKANSSLNINLATRDELIAIPGIGPKTADDILARRAILGDFKSFVDLEETKGLSAASVKILKNYTYIKKESTQ